jgi:hypothetical protein
VNCCCSNFRGIAETQFDERIARRDVARYRKRGPGVTTRLLRDLLVETCPLDGVLMDVGAGIGALTFELLDRGIKRAIAVDASPAYITVAAEEAARRRYSEVVRLVRGDFLEVADGLPTTTVVSLDRVICCYPAYKLLLEESLRHAERCVAISYPRDLWYVRLAVAVENGTRWFRRNPFRAFIHPVDGMRQVIQQAGFTLAARRQSWQWSADIYVR